MKKFKTTLIWLAAILILIPPIIGITIDLVNSDNIGFTDFITALIVILLYYVGALITAGFFIALYRVTGFVFEYIQTMYKSRN